MTASKVEIEVFIDANGEVRIKTHGLKGEACLEETKALEQALGRVKSRQKTSEYYAAKSTATANTMNKGK